MPKLSTEKKITGVVVPLGALYTKENPIIGEFADLVPFAQFCKQSGLKLIQLLPINDTGTQSSPYSGLSAFALHPIYIRISQVPGFDQLYAKDAKFKKQYDSFVSNHKYSLRYDYDNILNKKITLLQMLYEQTPTGTTGEPVEELAKWIKKNSWIKTYAVYKNLKWKYMQASWKSWLVEDQHKTAEEIAKLWDKKAFKKEHLFYAWTQFIADQQFTQAVDAVHAEGILLKGDMPILMNEDSCDIWAFPEFFNQNLKAGSPADGENPTGQNWGFPTYNWKNLKDADYVWWKDRLKTASKYYDAYRLDHILGFFRIWAIPATDCNALNGHTEPYACFKKDNLYELGFDDDRIRWLSKPHIPTGVVEEITWNHEIAHKILEILCERIGNEELWLFKNSVKGSQQIWDTSFGELCNQDGAFRIKQKLVEYWSNRTLLEVAKNKYIPLWTYGQSTSWGTLNETEKSGLLKLFEAVNKKNEKLWKKQADEIFTAITSDIKMIPCGEDLGVGIECVPKTMAQHNILGLRVVRWCRKWEKEGQPYIPFEDYTPLSVTTTSVHDSTTIRSWWDGEKSSDISHQSSEKLSVRELIDEESDAFTPEVAEKILAAGAKSASMWYVNPLQDYLYMNKEYWLENADDERINVPGSVNQFNWTYRIPCSVEALNEDSDLINKIKKITER